MTGGTAGRGRSMAATAPDGRAALQAVLARNWLPSPEDVTAGPHDLAALRTEFRRLFPDGVAFDTETLDGATDMRTIDPTLLATAVRASTASLDDGDDTVALAGRWLTPLYRGATLRLLFVLPADPEPAPFKNWLNTVRAWHFGAAAARPGGDSARD